jgi:hypothetical protein
MQVEDPNWQKTRTTYIQRIDLDRDGLLEEYLKEEEETELLYKAIFFALAIMLLTIIAW